MASNPQLVLAADDLGRTFFALMTEPGHNSPGNPRPLNIRAMIERFDHIPGTAEGGSAAQIAERTALQAAMATAFAAIATQVAGRYATLVAACAALTP
jgi:hypothetical protein